LSPDFEKFQAHCRDRCESLLPTLLDDERGRTGGDLAGSGSLQAACRYSLLNGGKRIRPMLVYAAGQAVDPRVDREHLDYPACAMEMMHVYSLVHDDLPAMDDDDLRRGKPSCHRAFDEATAILVGDGLQARAFELLARAPGMSPEQRIDMIRMLSVAAGCGGMVGGQAMDMAATDREITLAELTRMHAMKTGALIRAALGLGGVVAGAGNAQLQALDAYGERIGLAFQVVDDILDVEENTATLGKTGGKDGEARKSTYVKLMGLETAKTHAGELLEQALSALQVFDVAADPLRQLAAYIVERRH
jgi:farnesyl diphosphate synthase/geranylgeranyl diphosphate synthase type II